jgi:hypothetical protein
MHEVATEIRAEDGASVGVFAVAQLPGRAHRLEANEGRIVIEEEATYLFRVEIAGSDPEVRLRPGAEMFNFDDVTQRRGRLQPRQHVGRIRVRVDADGSYGTVTLSVEPAKLQAESEYRHMLDQIAEVATDALLQGFAPAALALEPDAATPQQLLYQQFALLHARLMGSGRHDLATVLHRPHTEWRTYEEHQEPGAPLRGGSQAVRALSRPGARVRTAPGFPIGSLPRRVTNTRSIETYDTTANRLILFALDRWGSLARRVLDTLERAPQPTGPSSRGVDAAREVLAFVNDARQSTVFRDVSPLRSFPSGNQVLQKRAGYRELFRTFVLTELGARLSLDWDLEDAFAASQRNIATLYEYWAFLQLARIIGAVCGRDLTTLSFVPTSDGMSLGFPQGDRSKLCWHTTVQGRALSVELYFNRDFRASTRPDSSWTRAMRPDCSVRIAPQTPTGDVPAADLSVWLHFDAKYKLEYAKEQFADREDEDNDAAWAEAVERIGRSKRQDLLKMHAYRDAIRRSAGAYVLFPGTEHRTPFTRGDEILPGLGAFPLRPTAHGAAGASELQAFVQQALGHVANRASNHERSKYWSSVIHRRPPSRSAGSRHLPSLSLPPSDAPVLCGYIRSHAHWAWIQTAGLYNVRAGNRRGAVDLDAEVLRAPDLLLYGPSIGPLLRARSGPWFVQSRSDLVQLGYPDARGAVYLCCPFERHRDEPEWLRAVDVQALASGVVGAPFVTSWQDLLDASDS